LYAGGGTPQDAKDLKAEKIRRLIEEGLRFYKPHPKQLEFHKHQGEKRGFFGGNQSGKTYAGGVEIAWTVGRVHPYRKNATKLPVAARDCCVDFNVLYSTIIPTYKRLLPRHECVLGGRFEIGGDIVDVPTETFEGYERKWPGLDGGSWEKAYDKTRHILYLADGSLIEFKTYEQGNKVSNSFAGPPRHIIRHDEEPPEFLYGENIARQITLEPNILFTMTPLNYSEWVYSQIYEASTHNPKIGAFMMSSADNPTATKASLAALEDGIKDDDIRAARLYGEFTFVKGRVWKEYGDHNLIDPFDIPRDWHRSVIIDPHMTKPTAVNWIAEDPVHERLYVYDEADLTGDIRHICDQISAKCTGQTIDLWLIDPSSQAENKIQGSGKLIDQFRTHLTNRIMPANNAREIGWDAVRQMVADNPGFGPRLYVSKSCPVTNHQMRNYSWKPPTKTKEDRSKPEVVKRNDDHCDCVRYRAIHRIRRGAEQTQPWRVDVYGA